MPTCASAPIRSSSAISVAVVIPPAAVTRASPAALTAAATAWKSNPPIAPSFSTCVKRNPPATGASARIRSKTDAPVAVRQPSTTTWPRSASTAAITRSRGRAPQKSGLAAVPTTIRVAPASSQARAVSRSRMPPPTRHGAGAPSRGSAPRSSPCRARRRGRRPPPPRPRRTARAGPRGRRRPAPGPGPVVAGPRGPASGRCWGRSSPHPEAVQGEIRFDAVDGVVAVVEHRRREYGVRARAKRLEDVSPLADAAGGDHGHAYGSRHRAQQLHIGPRSRAVAIPAGEQDLPRTQTRGLPRPPHRIGSPGLAAAERERFPPISSRATRIDGEHDALTAELGRELGEEGGALHRGGIHAHLVRTRSEEHTSELQSPIDISYAVF